MTNLIEHEGLEGEVFENLERLCVEGRQLVAGCRQPEEEHAPTCSEHELALAIARMPSADDDDEAFTPRLA